MRTITVIFALASAGLLAPRGLSAQARKPIGLINGGTVLLESNTVKRHEIGRAHV